MSHDIRTPAPSREQVTEVRRDIEVEGPRPHLDLSLSKILAGALAAASAAVAASWLGVAGTVLGAVVASIVVTVSQALYHRPLERSTEVLRQTLPLPAERFRPLPADSTLETIVLDSRDSVLDSRDSDDVEGTGTEIRQAVPAAPVRKRRVQWGTVLVSSMLTLVVGFGLLTTVEAFLGHSVSGGDGSTVSQVVERDSGTEGTGQQTPTTPGETKPTQTEPTSEPTDPEPTDPEPTDPVPTEPTDPEPTEPTPTEPTETDPTGEVGNDVTGAPDPGTTEPTAETTLSSATL